MLRREFLKLFGFGAVAAVAVAATMSPAQAAAVLTHTPVEGAQSPDEILQALAEDDAKQGEFAQYYYRRRYYRRRYYRRRYYRRRW